MATESNIVTMNVSLPQPLKQYVDGKVASGIYGSASEFVREAIREKLSREQERDTAKGELTNKLLQGSNGGRPVPYRKGHFDQKKKALLRRAENRRNAGMKMRSAG